METTKLLPLGSVVYLKEGNKKFLIIALCSMDCKNK